MPSLARACFSLCVETQCVLRSVLVFDGMPTLREGMAPTVKHQHDKPLLVPNRRLQEKEKARITWVPEQQISRLVTLIPNS